MRATHGNATALGKTVMARRKKRDMLVVSVVEVGLNMVWLMVSNVSSDEDYKWRKGIRDPFMCGRP